MGWWDRRPRCTGALGTASSSPGTGDVSWAGSQPPSLVLPFRPGRKIQVTRSGFITRHPRQRKRGLGVGRARLLMVLAKHQLHARGCQGCGVCTVRVTAPGSLWKPHPGALTLAWARGCQGSIVQVLHLETQCCSSPLDWENWAAVVALLLSHSHCLSPHWLTVSPEQRALLVGHSSDLLGASAQGSVAPGGACPLLGSTGSPDLTPRSWGQGEGQRGFCIWLDKSCSSCAAQLQPQVSRLVQEGPSCYRGWDTEPAEPRAEQVWGVEQHR